jgi:hypothetical protein
MLASSFDIPSLGFLPLPPSQITLTLIYIYNFWPGFIPYAAAQPSETISKIKQAPYENEFRLIFCIKHIDFIEFLISRKEKAFKIGGDYASN